MQKVSDVKSFSPTDAGRYSKLYAPAAKGLSATERALLVKLEERAPRLARLIADCEDAHEAREALSELRRLLA